MSEQKQPDSQAPTVESNVNKGRRRLSKAALATPVIASLAARPAMACSVSGFISGNTSPGRQPPTCDGYGCTPGFWKNNPWIWSKVTPYSGGKCSDPTSFPSCKQTWVIGGTTLQQILPVTCGTGPFTNPFTNASPSDFMLKIFLDGMNGANVKSNYALVCHYMAAILNAASTPAYGSTVEEIQQGLCKATQEGKLFEYKDILERLNERGCMYDAHGYCEDGFVTSEGSNQCIPACPDGQTYDTTKMTCVPKTSS